MRGDEHDGHDGHDEHDDQPVTPPPGFDYLQSKVELFLKIGPRRYCAASHLEWPPPSWDDETGELVRLACEQLARGAGFHQDTPVNGVGISAFYRTTELLRLEFVEQRALMEQDDYGKCVAFVDELTFTAPLQSQPVVLYNRTPSYDFDDELDSPTT